MMHTTGSLVRVMAILEELQASGIVTREMMAKVERKVERDMKELLG
jgi:hypothetical protein